MVFYELLGDAGVRSLDVDLVVSVSCDGFLHISTVFVPSDAFRCPSGVRCECQLSELSAGTSAWGRRATMTGPGCSEGQKSAKKVCIQSNHSQRVTENP